MGEPINIKGTKQGLIIFFDRELNFDEMKEFLQKKMESARGFFKGARFSLDEEQSKLTEDEKAELEEICLQHGLVLTENKIVYPQLSSQRQLTSIKNKEIKEKIGEETLLVRHSLRSGQSINYRGHVVILGDVHAGSEIIAEGNIIILGRCSGLVHAGATGNFQSIVMANQLCPTQLRICSSVVTSPLEKPQYPEIAQLVNNEINVSKYISSKA